MCTCGTLAVQKVRIGEIRYWRCEERERKCTHKRNIETRSRNPCCRWRAKSFYILWVCVCSLSRPTCSAHSPYFCRLWPAWLNHTFPYYCKWHDFWGKKVTEREMCVLIFSTTLVWNISHSMKNSARCSHKCTYIGLLHVKYSLFLIFSTTLVWNISHSMKNSARCSHKCTYIGLLHVKYSLFSSDFNETSVFSTDFEKYTYIKFRENPSNGSGVISCGRADRCTWRSFSQFCHRA